VPFVRLNNINRNCYHISFKFDNVISIYKYDNQTNLIQTITRLDIDKNILSENISKFESFYPSYLAFKN
jgi:hypothetical protein